MGLNSKSRLFGSSVFFLFVLIKLKTDTSFSGLAQLVELYIKAINTPGAIPNVQDAWKVIVETQCSDAKKAALKTYNTIMESHLSGKLPCDSGEIRKGHNAAFDKCENDLMAETSGLSTNTVEDCLVQLQVKVKYFNCLKIPNRKAAMSAKSVGTFGSS